MINKWSYPNEYRGDAVGRVSLRVTRAWFPSPRM
jgi:hypothetical protein